jgi:WD40 repeat protein
MKLRKFGHAVIAIVALALGSWSGVASAVPFSTGDVFASVGNGRVEEYSPTGTFIQTLNNGLGSAFTTGGVFDAAGNFYVTTFSSNVVSKFNSNGGLVNGSFMTGCNADCESITRDASGNAYVGHADGSHAIREYSLATGAFIQSFSGTTGPRGTDWVDLAKDQKTIFYTSEGGLIRRFDTSTNTQLANFNAVDALGNMFALRILADGGVLVAHTDNVLRYDSAGNLIKTYTFVHSGTLFALNLDPDGTSFWTGDLGGDNKIFRIDIATGNVLISFDSLRAGDNTLGGLTVFGEITQGCGDNCGGGGGTGVPEPATLLLLGSGLIVTVAVRRRARRSASGRRR